MTIFCGFYHQVDSCDDRVTGIGTPTPAEPIILPPKHEIKSCQRTLLEGINEVCRQAPHISLLWGFFRSCKRVIGIDANDVEGCNGNQQRNPPSRRRAQDMYAAVQNSSANKTTTSTPKPSAYGSGNMKPTSNSGNEDKAASSKLVESE